MVHCFSLHGEAIGAVRKVQHAEMLLCSVKNYLIYENPNFETDLHAIQARNNPVCLLKRTTLLQKLAFESKSSPCKCASNEKEIRSPVRSLSLPQKFLNQEVPENKVK